MALPILSVKKPSKTIITIKVLLYLHSVNSPNKTSLYGSKNSKIKNIGHK